MLANDKIRISRALGVWGLDLVGELGCELEVLGLAWLGLGSELELKLVRL